MPDRPPDDEIHPQFLWDPIDPANESSDEKLMTIVFKRCPPLGLQFGDNHWRFEMAFPTVMHLDGHERFLLNIIARHLTEDDDEPDPQVEGVFAVIPVFSNRFITN